MKKLLAVLSASFVFYATFANQRHVFSNLSVDDGLSQLNVTCIYQDGTGLMWFGTRNGLNMYNGNSFRTFWNHAEDPSSISDNTVSCILEDNAGNLWVGTDDGLNRMDCRHEFRRYYLSKDRKTLNNKIFCLHIDSGGTLWAGTLYGLYVYDPVMDILRSVPVKELENVTVSAIAEKDGNLYLATNSKGVLVYDGNDRKVKMAFSTSSTAYPIASDYIKELFIDRKENIWVGTYKDGVSVIRNDLSGTFHYNTSNGLSDNSIRCIRESPSGEIWIGTFNGLNIVNPVTSRIVSYRYGNQGTLSHHSIYSILFDRMQTIWVGTYAGGVDYSNPYGHLFDFYSPAMSLNRSIGILGPAVEHGGTLYIASEGGGLIAFDLKSENFMQYTLPKGIGGTGRSIFKTIFFEGNRILCGTSLGEIYSFDLKSHRYTILHSNDNGRPIYHIGKTEAGEYIIGGIGHEGLHIIGKDGKVQSTFPVNGKDPVSFPNVICVNEIDDGVFLIGTKSDGLYCYDRIGRTLISYNESHGLSAKFITGIHRDHAGRIWISSIDGGVSELILSTGKFITYDENSGLSNNQVCKIVEGNDNSLWLSTLNGISNIDLRTRNIISYGHESGIDIQEFSPCSGLALSDGRIFFAGNNGFTLFNPNYIITNPNVPPVILDKLYINNIPVTPSDDGILTEDISTQKRIVLNHDQTNIMIGYSALNYIFSNKNRYAYMLEGFDTDWNEVGNRRTAYFTNIPAGKYRFVVKGSNNDGIWNEEGASIEITVRPSLWKTWWAYLLYFIAASALVAFIIRYYVEKKRMQGDMRLKQAEAEMREEYYQERNRLFTNFSHELRTPLTLIIAPLDEFVNSADFNDGTMRKMRLMLRNAQRLLRIVNNLMDLQKNESGTMKLHLSENDIIRFSGEAVSSFQDLALYRNIHLSFLHTTEEQMMWFDWNLLEKVYFNFLSNAFKNTPDGGAITVEAGTRSLDELSRFMPERLNRYKNKDIRYLTVSIQDNGVGIASEDMEKIFLPFYQVAQNEHSKSGTGIGLSLSKAIVEMHHGTVWAQNAQGGGADFRFVLPIGKDWYRLEDFVGASHSMSVSLDVELPEDAFSEKTNEKRYSILVVEDNRDLNNYICSCLSDKYNVTGVTNGEDALHKAISTLPNLIITDLMMPKMDGMELIRRLKKDMNTSHIPIIMVTAKTGTDDIKEGYSAGADDYVTKPFDASVLKIRVSSLILGREKLKDLYSKDFSLESLGVDVTPVDEKFMQKLHATLHGNIGNSDLNLDDFCKELGLSKSNLYRKIKQITGYSPNEFIRNFRLNTAAKMLKETDMTITEVYVAVGYNSLAYFSNSFKALYGVSPTEYKNGVPAQG